MKYFKKYTYYHKLVFILSLLVLLFIIPYALWLYNSSKDKILESIQNSNDQSLMQIKYNYNTFNDMMTSLCFSVYLNNETNTLLYSPNASYKESTEYINYLKRTILNTNPSVHSISIYNGTQNKFYSTLTDTSQYLSSLNELMEKTEEIPKLQPVLRKVPYVGNGTYVYVFSYILYDYKNDENKPYSYIILDQNANWLIDNFTKIKQSNDYLPSKIYLLDQNGIVCSEDSAKTPAVDQQLLDSYFSKQSPDSNKDTTVYYTDNLHGKKYLITGLHLNDNLDSLVMIQDYDDVFAGLESFRNSFRIILIIWVVVLLLVIFMISKKLYDPVQKTLSYIGSLSGASIKSGNEFQQLMTLYKDSHDKQAKHTHATRHAIKQYQLERLLTDTSAANLKNFNEFLPEHWLSKQDSGYLRLLMLTVNQESSSDSLFTEADLNLYLFATQNILTELLEKEFQAEVIVASSSSILGIIHSSSLDHELILEDIIRKTKEHTRINLPLQIDVTYSQSTECTSELSLIYHELLDLHKYHYILGPDAIISPVTCKRNLENKCSTVPESLKKKCLNSIKCEHTQEAIQTILEIFAEFKEMKYEDVLICVMMLANEINFTLKEMCISRGVMSTMHSEFIYHKLDTAQYLEEIETGLTVYLTERMNIFVEKKEKNNQELFVKKIQDYIEENYSDPNLSSQMLGDYLNLTAKYVMKKFQDYSGTSLNDYITEVRMRQAAILLKNSALPISKISEQVGLLNENYFYKLFKKTYGCTPREFTNPNSSGI